MVLPDMVPVTAHSLSPALRLATIWPKPVCTGIPPTALMKSACEAEATRMRRPDRSARPVMAFLQKTTWAG